jgi:hypothetical protein
MVLVVMLVAVPGLAQTPHVTGDFNSWEDQSGGNALPMLDDGVAPDGAAGDGIYAKSVTITNPSPGTLTEGVFGSGELGLFVSGGNPVNFRLWFPSTVTDQDVVFTYDSRDLSTAGWAPGTGFSDDWTIGVDHDGSARTWVAVGSFQAAIGDTGDWNPASVITVMHDDGADGDLSAGDGIFTYQFTVPSALDNVEWKVVNQQADFTDSTKLVPEGWNIDVLVADRPGWFFSAKTGQTVVMEFDSLGGRMRARVRGPLEPVLLSEVAVSPSGATFIELINPNAFAVDLTGYYISDRADYYNVVVQAPNSGASDFIARFPADTVIAADGMLTVAFDGVEFFNTFAVEADFEILGTSANAVDLEENWAGAIGGSAGLTDGEETLVLFFWDGAGDLVIDSDYVFWGTLTPTNPAVNKTGVTVGSSTYLDDTDPASQAGTVAPGSGESVVRVDLTEGTETEGAGNGFWGHDETSENLDVTWALSTGPGPGCPSGQGLCATACIDIWADVANCGSCANACAGGENCCTGVCSDPQTDEANCNGCGNACNAGEGCCAGSCIDVSADVTNCGTCGNICPMGNNCCTGICSDPTSDEANCASCGNACGVGEGCCSSTCIDVQADTSNCGDCGVTCNAGENCCSGSCSDPLTDEANCGACFTTCNAGEECADGICCTAGQSNCSGACADLQTDPDHCGVCTTACTGGDVCNAGVCGPACGAGLTDCGGSCVDLQTDAAHCGACDNACTYANAQGVCTTGTCALGACDNLWGNCDADDTNGCEHDLSADLQHCGACDAACVFTNAAGSCAAGVCSMGACDTGFADCDSNPATGCEANLASPATCGDCATACSYDHAAALCNQGACEIGACDTGWGNCDANDANGCETDVRENTNHCGACDSPCQPGQVCTAGACADECPAGETKCEDVCADLQTSELHCGACDNACSPGEECSAGACVLPTYSISGVVRNKKSGQGLSGVILILDSDRETSSTSDGSYIFTEVTAGNHTLVAGADGFETETVQVVVADADLVQDIELTPKADEGCGCSTGIRPTGALLLLFLMLVFRRKTSGALRNRP